MTSFTFESTKDFTASCGDARLLVEMVLQDDDDDDDEEDEDIKKALKGGEVCCQ